MSSEFQRRRQLKSALFLTLGNKERHLEELHCVLDVRQV